MSIRPRIILVETHGIYNAPTKRCEELLESMGYAVTELGVADLSKDICVLLGRKSQD
jgi:hypothetical protein